MRVAILSKDYELFIKGEIVTTVKGFDIDQPINIDRVIDLDKVFDIDLPAYLLLEYIFGIEVLDIAIEDFSIDKSGNIYTQGVMEGFNEFVILENSTLSLNRLHTKQEL